MSFRAYMSVLVLLALGLGAGVCLWMGWLEREPETAAAPTSLKQAERRVIPEVATALRTMKLVTVEIDTSVTAQSEDDSWRGDVLAKVQAPVKLYFGTDLSGVTQDAVARNPITNGVIVRVPAPRRLAVEVLGHDEQTNVRVGGLRFRDLAGEYHLGVARTRLYDEAHTLELSPAQRQMVEQTTREQIGVLVRAIAGKDAPVEVIFGTDTDGAAGGGS